MGNLIARNSKGDALVYLTDIPEKNAYLIERLPACTLGEYLRLLNYFEDLGLKIYEEPGE